MKINALYITNSFTKHWREALQQPKKLKVKLQFTERTDDKKQGN